MHFSTHHRIARCHTFFYFVLFLAAPGTAQTFFAEVTDQAISTSYSPVIATTMGDYNNDGWPDLFLAEGRTSTSASLAPGDLVLLQNEGNGLFSDQNVLLPPDLFEETKGGGAIFGDYDNDGDLDLFMPLGGWWSSGRDRLLRNDQGVFHDVTLEAGLTDSLPTDNAVWLDYDRDGHLDLYVGHWLFSEEEPDLRNVLYRNNGDGTFANVTEETGLDVDLHPGDTHQGGGSGQGMVAADFDNDGWPDLYLSIFRGPNRLFLNNGNGGFRDATSGEIDDPGEALGVAVGDIDNDGLLDIFQAAGGGGGDFRSLMLQNLGEGQFLDITEGVGLSALTSINLLGVSLADIDNDGDLDLMTAQPHFLFLNNGDLTFVEATDQSGLTRVGLDLAFVDFDLDGFLDVTFRFRRDSSEREWGGLFRNTAMPQAAHHWLRVELVGTQSNRQGIGARLTATAGDLEQTRQILGGNGFTLGETIAHFGLAGRTQVDRLQSIR